MQMCGKRNARCALQMVGVGAALQNATLESGLLSRGILWRVYSVFLRPHSEFMCDFMAS